MKKARVTGETKRRHRMKRIFLVQNGQQPVMEITATGAVDIETVIEWMKEAASILIGGTKSSGGPLLKQVKGTLNTYEAASLPEVRTTSFQLGPDAEKDIVTVEALLMKLALAESVISDMQRCIEAGEKNNGVIPDDVVGPDDWAMSGLFQSLQEVRHALKCGCWGYEQAYMR
jgi:hypothetical protein